MCHWAILIVLRYALDSFDASIETQVMVCLLDFMAAAKLSGVEQRVPGAFSTLTPWKEVRELNPTSTPFYHRHQILEFSWDICCRSTARPLTLSNSRGEAMRSLTTDTTCKAENRQEFASLTHHSLTGI